MRSRNLTPGVNAPTWGEMSSLINNRNLPIIHTASLPFIPHPVTDSSTVYTATNNSINILKQLDENALALFCDEGFYRIVVDIYLKCLEKFKQLIPCMASFHMAKCVQCCIGKYVKVSGIEDAFIEMKALSKKIVKKFWNAAHCVRSLRAISILYNIYKSF